MEFYSHVTNVQWERIHLFVTLQIEGYASSIDDLHFYLLKSKRKTVEAEFNIQTAEKNRVILHLNITQTGINRCVSNGSYMILAVSDNSDYSVPTFRGTNQQLETWCRCYRYNGNNSAYTVTFALGDELKDPSFKMLFYDIKGSSAPTASKSNNKFLPIKWAKKIFMRWKKKHGIHITERYIQLCKHLEGRQREKNILFLSDQNDYMALNMQALYRRMQERGLDREYHVYFFLKKMTISLHKLLTRLKHDYYVGKCATIIVDDHVPLFDRYKIDPNDTKLIQIWHAGAGFKGVGFSRWGHGGPGTYSAHRQYTYSISPSSGISEFFSEQFGITNEQVIPTGMPRMDEYISPEHRAQTTQMLYRDYPMLKDKFVVLFAPTYRGKGRKTAFYPYDRIDFDEFYRYCMDKNAVILFKMHPWCNDSVPIPSKYADRMIDMSGYFNINDLFYVTDLLITDYSSSMYEFMLMKKPMLFYAFDRVQYSNSRGFHRDYESNILGKCCDTFAELIKAMREEDYEFEKVEANLPIYFDRVDSNSSDRVIDWLILGNLPQEFKDRINAQRAHIAKVRGLSFAGLINSGIKAKRGKTD